MKFYNDAVHGHIVLPDYVFYWVDTSEFQRLRRIKQLGAASYVFEGATHTRFGHSIGVAYLANKMATTVKNMNEFYVSEETVEDITVAGLLHDLGHGPFSHLFEDCMKTFVPEYSHEKMSCRVIDYMWCKYQILMQRYSKTRIQFIKSLILGEVPPGYSDPWHYEIVSNPTTSIDVDKFDYFQRDTKYANVHITYDPSRFFTNFRIIDKHIVYLAKEIFNIYELYHTRYVLFRMIYLHRAVTEVYTMIREILTSTDLSRYTNVEKFLQLTDDFLYTFDSEILARLHRRDLYKVVWEGTDKPYLTESALFEFDPELEGNVTVVSKTANFTRKNNPVNSVLFCNSFCSTSYFTQKDANMLVMEKFEEVVIRVVSRRNHELTTQKVTAFMRERNLS